VRSFLVAVFVLLTASSVAAAPALVPRPRSVAAVTCADALSLTAPLSFAPGVDPGGLALLRERWQALGIPAPRVARPGERARVTIAAPSTSGKDEAYTLTVNAQGVAIRAESAEGAFDALTTLAQLPERNPNVAPSPSVMLSSSKHGPPSWHIACTRIDDAPALRWRIVSDDVSRGPFPTMRYAHERIRTLASLKINGWSPYMENVVVDPRAPFVAWPNGWTPEQLHALADYARRFHVTLIPEQQTFSHMHETLKWEQEAPLAELPHGYLLSESDPRTYAYLGPLVRSVVAATKPAPFVHLGADEPIDLGRGRTPRTPQVYADHVKRVAAFLAGSGVRPMIWDDAIQQDHTILSLLPRDTVIVTWHYGAEKTFRPYIDTIANAGFDQLVAPGASNWTEIYPDLTTAYANVGRMLADGKGTRGVLGMFMTDWHDDGETLYEATWPALAYAAASAWQTTPVDDTTWHEDFARAFFGSDDPRYAADLDRLRAIRDALRTHPGDPIDYLFWRSPFDPALQTRAQALDLAGIRARAEEVLRDLWTARPPLHPEAVAVMKLAALRYDALARRLQIGKEARDYYEDARAHATKPDQSQVYRSLGVAKYLCWEMRDAIADIEPLYAAAWRYESTPAGLEHILPQYRIAEDDAQRCADRIDGVIREDYLRKATVPSWDEVISSAR
jgi:hexosaminidase